MAGDDREMFVPLRGLGKSVGALQRALPTLWSLEDPSDDMPNMTPDDPAIMLHDAADGDVGYCGRCAFWNAPAVLGDSGTCQIVTGTIEATEVCLQFSARMEAADLPAECLPGPGQGDSPEYPVMDMEMPDPGIAPTVEGDTEAAVLGAFQLEGQDDNGFIVSLQPTPDEAAAIAQPDGIPAEMLHVTLAYIDGTVEEHGDRVLEVLGRIADEYGPISGSIVGLGYFGDAGFDGITFALLDADGLAELATELIGELKEFGIPVNEDHDFIPHMTLADGPIPADAQVIGLPITSDSIYLRDGAESVPVTLMGGDQAEETPMPAPSETAPPDSAPADPNAPPMGASIDREARVAAALAAMSDEEVQTIVAAGSHRLTAAHDCGCGGGSVCACSVDPLAVKVASSFATTEFTAIMSHETGTSDDPWDGAAETTMVKSPADEDFFANIYAWRDDEADTSVKAAYRFIHHFINAEGAGGEASTVACSAGIGVLNGGRGGTTIPDADRQGVYDHLARHLTDAGRVAPALMAEEDASAVARAVDAGFEVSPEDPESVLAALEHQLAAEDAGQRLSAARVGAELGEVMAEATGPTLADVPDDALVSELARRWAEGVAAEAEQAADALREATDAATLAAEDDAIPVEGDAAGEEAIVGDFAENDGYEWTGVLIVEDLPSGDGRMIAGGALTWRELPIPLMLQTKNAPGHDGAEIAGSIQKIERQGQDIVGWGVFDSGTAGTEYQRLLTEKTMRGVSADIDSVVVEFRDPTTMQPMDPADVLFGGPMIDVLEVLVEGRIMGATGTPFPAFQEAYIELLGKAADDQALVASAGWITQHTGSTFALAGDGYRAFTPIERAPWVLRGQEPVALVASGGLSLVTESPELEIPLHPPVEWFQPTGSDESFTVHPDGRISGLIARWGTCHIGNSLSCTPVPKSHDGYKHFRTKKVLSAEGELIATGPLVMDTVHPDLALIASDAAAHYHDTGCAVADVAVYDGEFGIEICGALRPDVTPEKIRALRGSDVSPDWRQVRTARGGRRLEAVGLLAVNESGFIVPDLALVASGGSAAGMARGRYDSVSGEVTALVAAGMVFRPRTVEGDLREMVLQLADELAELREAVRPLRAERMASKFAARVLEAAQPSSSSD